MVLLKLTGPQWTLLLIILRHYIGFGNTQEEGDACFTKITLDDTENHELTSPDYPESPRNTRCTWQIDVKRYHQNMTINLVFNTVGTNDSDICSSEFVKVISNSSLVAAKTELVVLCGQEQKQFEFFIDSILIIYQTGPDETQDGLGFRLVYRMLSVSSCSETHAYDGRISSPGYPNPYPSFQRCTYLLETGSVSDIMQLELLYLHLSPNCVHDYLLVYDGKSEDGIYLGTYCGDSVHDFAGFYKNFFIVFVSSDNSGHRAGFEAKYDQVMCGEDMDVRIQDSRVIFPGYSHPFTEHIKCQWTLISGYELHRIVLSFIDLHMACKDGVISVTDAGTGRESTTRHFCDNPEQMYLASGPKLVVKLLRDNKFGNPISFVMHFRGELQPACGKERLKLTSYEYAQTIESPEYPIRYPDYVNCVWEVKTASRENTIKLTVDDVDLEEGCFDSLNIYNGYVEDFSIISDKHFCGHYETKDTEPFESEGDTVTIHFTSNGAHSGQGFKIYYQSVSKDYYATQVVSPTSGNGVVIAVVVSLVVLMVVIVAIVLICVIRKRRSNSQSADHVYTHTRDPSVPSLVSMRGSISAAPPPSYQEVSTTMRNENGVDPEPPPDTSLPPSYSEAMLNNMIQTEWF